MTTQSPLVRWPAVVSSRLAVVVLVASVLIAQALVPTHNPILQTVSELSARDAPSFVFLTVAILLVGVFHLVTAVFATGVALAGRIALALGGVLTFAIAYFSLPTAASTSTPHRLAAMAGLVAFSLWPLLGHRRSAEYPWLVRLPGALVGTAVLVLLSAGFLGSWSVPGFPFLGLVERACVLAQVVWPALVVQSLLRSQRQSRVVGVG